MKKIKAAYYKSRNKLLQVHPHFYSFCDKRKSVIKFFFAGVCAASVNLIFLAIFHKGLNWSIVPATSFAFVLSFVVSFNLQKFWTFRDNHKGRIPRQLIIYMLNALLALSLNGYFMHLLVSVWGVWYLLAQVIVNVTIGLQNFFLYKFVIFPVKK